MTRLAAKSMPMTRLGSTATRLRDTDNGANWRRFCCKKPCNTSARKLPFRFNFSEDLEDTMASSLEALQHWVNDVAALTRPARIHWCDGSDAEYQALVQQMLQTGTLIELNQ